MTATATISSVVVISVDVSSAVDVMDDVVIGVDDVGGSVVDDVGIVVGVVIWL